MLPRPTKFSLVAGNSEGLAELNAFDGALLKAGVANVNLVKISSILPPGAQYVDNLELPEGSLVPTAYGTIISGNKGERIAAAISVARSHDRYGVIMEFAGRCSKEEAEEKVRQMAVEAFKMRGLEPMDVLVRGVEHVVDNIGCAFAAAVLWY